MTPPPPPPPPNCAWGWPCHAPSVGWAPLPREEEAVVCDPLPDLEAPPTSPREEEAVVCDPLPDLEAPPPPPAIPGATDERVVDCSAEPAGSFTVINFLRGVLVTLWVGMIYAMVHYAWSNYHEKGWGIMVVLEFAIAVGVTPYFDIAVEALDDAESSQ
ncbi:hypothetical protein PAHAL_8G055900 [Panicum hallii]|uniref:Uncharacterized protein n=1 Tax=Panicum hallii TaxID=206008 RepID=A0A2S3ID31_9POAL|nr:formin-like protein 5 [Panicum hallii]XP_025828238.1 formin-like protein 5 [Panicum hallii]PAN41596.1 hypothetical protein PAHAL_8G055500 [Panicum hallii]PVH33731.1 hypothetical protein PAHAL_8G055900 [Panicum hallii]